jgi:AcrR family transcriptional regulator
VVQKEPGAVPRAYDARRRRELGQASRAQTRARVLAAAGELFVSQGYPVTTIAQIAKAAGVSVQSIYLAVGGKAEVLRALTAAMVAGAEPEVGVTGQSWVAEIAAEPDPREQLRLLARGSVALAVRAAPLWRIMASAAADDPSLAEDLAQQATARWQDQSAFVGLLHGPLRGGMTAEQAGDILYTIASPPVWELLTGDRGWSPGQVEAFLADTLTRLLLGD